jgi:hypothetical protein
MTDKVHNIGERVAAVMHVDGLGSVYRTGTVVNFFSDLKTRKLVYVVKSQGNDFRMAHSESEVGG